jgi:hypothetical protein
LNPEGSPVECLLEVRITEDHRGVVVVKHFIAGEEPLHGNNQVNQSEINTEVRVVELHQATERGTHGEPDRFTQLLNFVLEHKLED